MLQKTITKTKAQPAAVQPSLAERIKTTCAEAEAFIAQHVDSEKAAHPMLPRDWIALNVRSTTRAGNCACKIALALLSEKKDG